MKLHVLIEQNAKLPATLYGGTERVVWYLAEELHRLGHKVTFLAAAGSKNPFGDLIIRDKTLSLNSQVPDDVDIIHLNSELTAVCSKPVITTVHGNLGSDFRPKNAVYVSQNHAQRHGGEHFVYNGMNWDDYGDVDFTRERQYYHFLGKAAWRVKNVKGAIRIINSVQGERLRVLGGTRVNLKMGLRVTLSPKVKFCGMVGGAEKNELLGGSKGLIFPVLWDEPFGLALTESLYMGAPVFGANRGSLVEIINNQVGYLSNSESDLAQAIKENNFDKRICSEYARDCFNSRIMAQGYLQKYEMAINNSGVL